jgi:hypothetical protein
MMDGVGGGNSFVLISLHVLPLAKIATVLLVRSCSCVKAVFLQAGFTSDGRVICIGNC